jgi:cell division protein FtsB
MRRLSSKNLALVLAVGVLAPAPLRAGSESQARRYERLMVQVHELREQADRLRDEAARKGELERVRGRTKALEAQADALEQKARAIEPAGWPPSR